MLNSAKIIPAVQQFKENALFLKKTGGGGGGGGGGSLGSATGTTILI